MKDLFEQLGDIFDPVKNAELIRQSELEAQIKEIQNED